MANTNPGKRFEEDFRESVKDSPGVSLDRLIDPMGGFKGVRNICDFIIFRRPFQHYMEMKSTDSDSLDMNKVTDNQREGLFGKSKIPGVSAGVLINYRNHSFTVWVDAASFAARYLNTKSLPLMDALSMGLLLNGELQRTRYRYDVDDLLDKIERRVGL